MDSSNYRPRYDFVKFLVFYAFAQLFFVSPKAIPIEFHQFLIPNGSLFLQCLPIQSKKV